MNKLPVVNSLNTFLQTNDALWFSSRIFLPVFYSESLYVDELQVVEEKQNHVDT